jgi:hypothetical protein
LPKQSKQQYGSQLEAFLTIIKKDRIWKLDATIFSGGFERDPKCRNKVSNNKVVELKRFLLLLKQTGFSSIVRPFALEELIVIMITATKLAVASDITSTL